jgi:hypothetical protein
MKQGVLVVARRHCTRYIDQLERGELEAVGDDEFRIVRHVRSVVTGESLDRSQSPKSQTGLGDSKSMARHVGDKVVKMDHLVVEDRLAQAAAWLARYLCRSTFASASGIDRQVPQAPARLFDAERLS